MAQNIVTAEKIKNRVSELIAGADLTQSGRTNIGEMDVEVAVGRNGVSVGVSVHGYDLAKHQNTISLGETRWVLFGEIPGRGGAMAELEVRQSTEKIRVLCPPLGGAVPAADLSRFGNSPDKYGDDSLRELAGLLKIK